MASCSAEISQSLTAISQTLSPNCCTGLLLCISFFFVFFCNAVIKNHFLGKNYIFLHFCFWRVHCCRSAEALLLCRRRGGSMWAVALNGRRPSCMNDPAAPNRARHWPPSPRSTLGFGRKVSHMEQHLRAASGRVIIYYFPFGCGDASSLSTLQ